VALTLKVYAPAPTPFNEMLNGPAGTGDETDPNEVVPKKYSIFSTEPSSEALTVKGIVAGALKVAD
jgi:hypothetical protein